MRRFTRLLLLSIVLVGLAGCAVFLADRSRLGIDRDSAIFLSGGQPRTLDPARAHGGPGSITGHVFSGLVTLDTALTVQPDMAVGWQVDDTNTVYTFYLHPFAQFHDGRPVTADDVLFSWTRALQPDTASDTALTYLGDIVGAAAVANGAADTLAGVTVIDDQTLQVTVDAPKPYFLAKLTFPAAFVVDRNQVARSDWTRQPNGTGPFKLETWEDDELLVLARHDAYYGPAADVEHVVYDLGSGLPLEQYENGEIDLVGIGGSTIERARDPNDPLSADLRTTVSLCTSYIGFNVERPPFNDPRVRQAFNYALDREAIVEGLFRGQALPAEGILPPGMPGYGAAPGYPFDPDKARALLREAGYDTVPVLTYVTSGYTDLGSFETAIISQWEETLGVTIEPRLIDPFVFIDEIYAGNIGHLFDTGWCADYPDPENFLDLLFFSGAPSNLGGYSNPALDERMLTARVEPDPTRRLEMYQAIERDLVLDAPVAFVVHRTQAVLVSDRLEGYVLTPLSVAQWHRVRLSR